jgi:hypothetical protein
VQTFSQKNPITLFNFRDAGGSPGKERMAQINARVKRVCFSLRRILIKMNQDRRAAIVEGIRKNPQVIERIEILLRPL